MKHLINTVDRIIPEMLTGEALLSPGTAVLEGWNVLVRADIEAHRDSRKVAVISGGGSGHEPAHGGYVGSGMLTAAVAGDVFTSPSTDAVLAAIRATATAAGALLLVKNYTGDRLNFGLAAEIARSEGIPVEMVIIADDVALSDTEATAGARGLAGTVLVHKITGALAESGAALAEVHQAAAEAARNVRTMGIALRPCSVPGQGASFSLGDDQIEVGLGIHGEAGVRRMPVQSAAALVEMLFEPLLAGGFAADDTPVALLVNNLGGTSAAEMSIVVQEAVRVAAANGLDVRLIWGGGFLTSLDMAGFSISLMRLDDTRHERLLAPTSARAWQPGTPGRRRPASVAASTPADDEGDTASAGDWSDDRTSRAVVAGAKALIADESRLTEIDQHVGDGDMGVNLARGARAIVADTDTIRARHPADVLERVSRIVRRDVGGTSGALYAALLLSAANRLRGSRCAAADWAGAARDGVETVRSLGGAEVGDCTMLDALEPLARAVEQACAGGQGVEQTLQAALEAARDGAATTRTMIARRGRASYLGERAQGHGDPGAEAVVTWLDAVARTLT